jgi:Subunit 11 of the general transcription factor TFIIH
MSLALILEGALPHYPPIRSDAMEMFNKLDAAFASLATGRNVETGEPLPGCEGENGYRLSMTEKIRIKSLAERSRLVAFRTFEEEDDDDDEEEAGLESEITPNDMSIANVYMRTITELGREIDNGPLQPIAD